MATAHQRLAQRVEADVERPLKEFMSKNREMQALSTIQGNIAAIAKEIEITNDKADKLKRKGAKASASKVATATSELESANAQWISQAPFVFEALQSADETRLNHLRDALTQFQTHELDWVEQTRAAVEQCVNELLNVETSDETSTFVARASGGRPRIEQQRSRTITSSAVAPSMPAAPADDSASLRSARTEPGQCYGCLYDQFSAFLTQSSRKPPRKARRAAKARHGYRSPEKQHSFGQTFFIR